MGRKKLVCIPQSSVTLICIFQSSLPVSNCITHTRAMTSTQTPTAISAPNIVADHRMRAFRQEAGLSWPDFNSLWADICQFVNSPAYDTLLDISKASQQEYQRQMKVIASDILRSSIFHPTRMGTWAYTRYDNEPDLIMWVYAPPCMAVLC